MRGFLHTLTTNWWGILIICVLALIVWVALSALLYKHFFKRFYDIVISGVAILVISPILLILTILGAIKMKGNPFFTQLRPGKNGKIFKLIKFRTMTNERDENGELLHGSKRLTRYGRVLRATSLDELPELINIFIGNMSLVGPRPLLEMYLPYYTDEEKHRHDVRPGLTGLAQVNGRNLVNWDERLAYDVRYVKNISLWNDLKIIFTTVLKVLKRADVEYAKEFKEGGFIEQRQARMAKSIEKKELSRVE